MPFFSHKKEKLEAEVSRQAMEACEHVISEMGAELHDDLIQRLSILRLSIDKLERSVSDQAQAEILLVNMKAEFQEVIQSVRKISKRLLPLNSEDHTFQRDIEILCQNMERPGMGRVHFEFSGDEQQIPKLAEKYLSRIVQELIHNAYKHSSAWNVWVRLSWEPGKVNIKVEDDGSGFSKIAEFIERLRMKYGTLRMRSQVIGASISYLQGEKGLLASVEYPIRDEDEFNI